MGIFRGSDGLNPQEQVDLEDLKSRVSRLESTVAILQAQSGPLAASATPASAAAPVEAAWLGEVRELVAQRKKIQAIKVYREHTGLGLKEAKDAVEAMPGPAR